jgi:hypothetical protein
VGIIGVTEGATPDILESRVKQLFSHRALFPPPRMRHAHPSHNFGGRITGEIATMLAKKTHPPMFNPGINEALVASII